MTPQISQTADKHIESELDRLTYSAYLLTLDPGLAVSVVMTAIDGSLEEITTGPDLLERTVELALEQLRRESSMLCFTDIPQRSTHPHFNRSRT
jgi:hypothetical protein